MNPLRVAVFGCGHLGRIHTRLVRNHADIQLVGVFDTLPTASAAAAREFETTAWTNCDLLAEQIDAAIVATPTVCHHEVASQLLRRGVHCLVEKPITSTMAEADELVRAAADRALVLQVGHVERFNPAWRAVRPHVSTPRLVQATRASGYTFRSTDVGVVLDLMIHDLDLVLSLWPSEIVQVSAWGQALVGPHEDVAYARLQFADGGIAQLTASRVSFEPQRNMQILCAELHASIDFAAGSARIARVSDRVRNHAALAERLTADEKAQLRDSFFRDLMPVDDVPVPRRNAIEDEQLDFLASIRGRRSPQVTGADARRTLGVAHRILEQIAATLGAQPPSLACSPTVALPIAAPFRKAG